jgi:hypothetical protein
VRLPVFITMLHPALALTLTLAFESRPSLVPSALIVGRAVCGDATFLLTETPQIVELAAAGRTAAVRPLRGTTPQDKFWGLACTRDGTLWTMASPWVLGRLDRSGAIAERITLTLPRIALFAAGDRLLYQELPLAVGAPALTAATPGQARSTRPWPPFLVRKAASPEQQVSRNLVTCGLGVDKGLPCWFAADRQFIVSDGASWRMRAVARWLSERADVQAPIRDVALTAAGAFWLLESVPGPRGVAGGRLVFVDEKAAEGAELELRAQVRLILAASASRCWLLTLDGAIVEVAVTP